MTLKSCRFAQLRGHWAEWDAVHNTNHVAENSFIDELRTQLTRLTDRIDDREKNFTKELEKELYKLRNNPSDYAATGVESLKQLFPEVVSRILVKYE